MLLFWWDILVLRACVDPHSIKQMMFFFELQLKYLFILNFVFGFLELMIFPL